MQFPNETATQDPEASPAKRPAGLQEKIDVHRLLFERAWRMDENR